MKAFFVKYYFGLMKINKTSPLIKVIIILLAFDLLFSCKTQQKVRLKDLYTKIGDEVMGNYAYDTSKGPSLALTKKKTEVKEAKKERIKARVFYGYKTRRAYAKTKKGQKYEYEIFFVLKKPLPINPYLKEVYWYNRKKRKIVFGPIPENEGKNAKLLHGPYLRRQGKIVLEEGIFYVGGKHGRWEKYDKNFILIDKKRFYKGFPTDAEISYFDLNNEKPKEIIPIQLGVKEGNYYKFDEQGNMIMQGVYKNDSKIGIWIEYHTNKKKKREIQYAKDAFIDFKPFIIKEYDPKGKVLYDYKKDGPIPDSLNNFKF